MVKGYSATTLRAAANWARGSNPPAGPRRPATPTAMKHRDDIDGMRAIAILPVLAFHFGMYRLAPGGFIGVDVFFVISGYLITGVIYHGIGEGTYSITDFYSRRVRRLFPALFAMFAACMVATFLLAFPSEARDAGRSMLGSLFFVSNILFYHSSGYFAQQKNLINPLLHTWSLSVEEQFYVLFPIVVFALRRFSSRVRIGALAALAAASLAASAWMVREDAPAAFYLVQFRAWELLMGSLLAIGAVPPLTRRWHAELVGAAGVALVLAGIELFSPATPFPGLAALLPCLGTAAVLHSGRATTTLTARCLSWRPLRFIGLISYSLYLWHWPVIVFYRAFREPDQWQKLGLIALCLVLAALSWRFIEQPFRVRRRQARIGRTLGFTGAAMAATAILAVVLGPASRAVWHVPPRAERVLAYTRYKADAELRAGTCFLYSGANDFAAFDRHRCLALKPDRPNVLIIGDSHAADLWSGLSARYPDINFLQATASGCKPVLAATGERRCTELMRFVFRRFLPVHPLDGVILSAQWAASDAPLVKATVAALKRDAGTIYVFGPIVEYTEPLPRILALGIEQQVASEAKFAARHRKSAPAKIDHVFAETLAGGPGTYRSIYHTLCHQGCAVWAKPDVPLQFDTDHMTRAGSVFLATRLGPLRFVPPPTVMTTAAAPPPDL